MYRNLWKAFSCQTEVDLEINTSVIMEMRYATRFWQLDLRRNFSSDILIALWDSDLNLENPKLFPALRRATKLEGPNCNSLSTFMLHSPISYLALKRKWWQKKDIIFMSSRLHLANSNSNLSILKLFPDLRRATKLWQLIETWVQTKLFVWYPDRTTRLQPQFQKPDAIPGLRRAKNLPESVFTSPGNFLDEH